jgi:hypothetical protein
LVYDNTKTVWNKELKLVGSGKFYRENVYTEQGDMITPPILVTMNYWFVCMNIFASFFRSSKLTVLTSQKFRILNSYEWLLWESWLNVLVYKVSFAVLLKNMGYNSIVFLKMYLSQAHLACVKGFVSDVLY